VWNFPDGIPLHREPLYGIRPDLVDKYPTHDDVKVLWRLPTLYKSVQEKYKNIGKDFPSFSPAGAWSSTRAAARRRAPIRGLPS